MPYKHSNLASSHRGVSTKASEPRRDRQRTFLHTGMAMALAALSSGVSAQDRLEERLSAVNLERFEGVRLSQPLHQRAADAGAATLRPEGRVQVLVRLKGNPAARNVDKSRAGINLRKAELKAQQGDFIARAAKLAPGVRVLNSTQMVLNAVVLEADVDQLDALLGDDAVDRVSRVGQYQLDLTETVPYIGGTAVQNAGFDGSGVKVAVFDSGIDYYHADLGGSGDPADYAADNPDIIEPGTFPTAKVVGGFDFTGSVWPNGPEVFDPDPLDDGPFAGHGTHVADIISGVNGVAPGADLYAVKTCSSVSGACSGLALIAGMEYAVDPDGDGDISDRMDIINMSLGSNYGQPFDDDLAAAVDAASALGVLTVASAGNGSNKPYITGTPAAAPTALSVAQTAVPTVTFPLITVEGSDYLAVFQSWSVEPASPVEGPLQYGDGSGGNLLGCDPFTPGSLTGLTVLVDRGACAFSVKISNISDAGGAIGIIGLVAPGAPFNGGFGGGNPSIPGYMVSQADADAMKGQLGALAIADPSNTQSFDTAGSMVASSSRGPSNEYNQIKPEIGAPGASISAVAGSGTGTEPFGGTSGAAPMVAGSAALLMEAEPGLEWHEVKARLINTGETDVVTEQTTVLAPVSRIGGGEVRVDRAVAASTGVWEQKSMNGALSFGFVDAHDATTVLRKNVVVHNYSDQPRTYSIDASFRDPADAASGAVTVSSGGSLTVGAMSSEAISVTLTIDGARLPDNTMNSGSNGANPDSLTAQEFDGYLSFTAGAESVHMPWHVLPRKSADLKTRGRGKTSFGSRGRVAADGFVRFRRGDFEAPLSLDNLGVGTAQNAFYSLVATSGVLPKGGLGEQSPTPDIRAIGVNTIPVPAGSCSANPSFLWEFAINTWERQTHLLPVKLIVSLDIDQDGSFDYQIANNDLSAFDTGALNTISDGRQVSLVLNLNTGDIGAFFFASHITNTANTVLTVCAEQLGLSPADLLTTNVDMEVEAFDFYFGGPGDVVSGLTVTPLGEQFFVPNPVDVPGGDSDTVTVQNFGTWPGNTRETGLLLFSNGTGGAREGSEAMILQAR